MRSLTDRPVYPVVNRLSPLLQEPSVFPRYPDTPTCPAIAGGDGGYPLTVLPPALPASLREADLHAVTPHGLRLLRPGIGSQ